MDKFMKSVRGLTGTKQTLIKNAITSQLSNSIKEIQLFGMEENLSGDSMDMPEAENTLCTIIEALFLHGVKDTLGDRFRRALADVDIKPEPNFWPPLLVISHKQTIDQIQHLSQINTEIGQCRAWIRVVLNDCLLSSYITTIRQDPSTIKSYYNAYAYIRDNELLDVAQRLIEGLETFKTFMLPCNSSLLNAWPLPTLLLAGVWAPTLRSCPVTSGVDVAESLQITTSVNSETCSLGSAVSVASHNSGIAQMLGFNEDEALKIILARHSDNDPLPVTHSDTADQCSTAHIDNHKSTSHSSLSESKSDSDGQNFPVESHLGNSLNKRSGWSFDERQTNNGDGSSNVAETSANINDSQSGEHSFNALIESYNMLSGINMQTPGAGDIPQLKEEGRSKDTQKTESSNVKYVVESLSTVHLTSVALAAQIGTIAMERGLDVQNFECAGCKQPLGLGHKPKVCAFTGNYYCDNCVSVELVTIPARIIHNWDFKRYSVSQTAFNYINEIKDHPTIDLKILNPFIYGAVEEMSRMLVLRNQLNFLRAYLYTCQEPIIEQLQKQMWPREYMYEHIHQYSISDLGEIINGNLAGHLQKVVNFAKQHVLACWLCSQKGFICEICTNSKALFPFDVDKIYRCDVCSAVYHKGCLNASSPCPKCERKRKREDLPLLGATIE